MPKDKGGLGLPNLKYYYCAAQLTVIVNWLGGDKDLICNQVEQGETS